MAWRMSALGFLGITVWVFQLRLQAADLAERLVERSAGAEAGKPEGRTDAVREPRLRGQQAD